MICYVCDKDNWHSLKELNAEKELRVCKDCGNVAYKIEEDEEAKNKNFYRFEYRPEPTHENLLTTTRKLNYVRIFLKDFLNEKKGLVCGDIGSATGYIINWMRQLGHKATGCELTLTYRRFCEHFYGIPVTEELETKHKYDLITIYHVLEHLIEPDKKLAHYASLLADGGHIMVSTPEWLKTLEEASGTPLSTFEHLFHKNHINVFTERSIKNLFAKIGLEIVKEDFVQYGQTYLLKKSSTKDAIVTENWEEIVKKITTQKKAIYFYRAKQYREALDIWPKFPEAWIGLIYEKYQKDPESQEKKFEEAHNALGDNWRLAQARAAWLYQHHHFEACIKQSEWINSVRPNEHTYMFMAWSYDALGQPKKAMNCYIAATDINPMKWQEVMDYVCRNAARIPCWEERAVAALKADVLKKAEIPKPEFRDPVMEAK